MHYLTAWGKWALEIVQYRGTKLLQCSASLPGVIGQCNSCELVPHRPRAVGRRQYNSWYAVLHCLGALRSGIVAMHCLGASGPWGVKFVQLTASLPSGSRHCNSCNALPHCLRSVGSGIRANHCLTAAGQGVVKFLRLFARQLLQCSASGVVGTAIRAMQGFIAPRLFGGALQELHCPLAQGSSALHESH